MSFYENNFILKWIGILGWIIWSIQIVLKIISFMLSELMNEFYKMEDILKAKARINMI